MTWGLPTGIFHSKMRLFFSRSRVGLSFFVWFDVLLIACQEPESASGDGADHGQQISVGRSELDGHSTVSTLRFTRPTEDEIRRAQARADQSGLALLGVNSRANLTPATHGVWSEREGQHEWRLTIRSTDALFIALALGDFAIPSTAQLHVMNKGGAREGLYTAADRNSYGGLYIPPVAGDELTLLLRDTESSPPLGDKTDLTVSLLTYGLFDLDTPSGESPRRGLGGGTTKDLTSASEGAFGFGPSCGPDVQCAPHNVWPWSTVRRGEVYIAVNSVDFSGGSGGLLNNTSNDCTPYVLTAKHVIPDQISPTNATYYYNYQKVNCTTAAPTNQKRTGSVTRASSSATDFALVEINQAPNGSPDVRFNGWSRSASPPAGAATIHHPNNLPAEIAVDEDPLVAAGTGSWAWKAVAYEDGATFSGSSGGNLFNGSGRVVGQLHGGIRNEDCVDGLVINDLFGRFDLSWTGGGTAATRLKDWLDPTNSNATTIAGVDSVYPLACTGISGLMLEGVVIEGPGETSYLSPGQQGVLRASVAYVGPPDGQVDVESATLNATDGLTVIEPYKEAPASLEAGQKMTFEFPVSVSPEAKCGDPIKLAFDLVGAPSKPLQDADWDGGWHPEREFRVGQEKVVTLAAEQFLPPAGWSKNPPWEMDAQFPQDEGSATLVTSTQADASLTSPAFTVESGMSVELEHRFDTSNFFDGAVIEYSVSGGQWQDAGALIVEGGYQSTIWGKSSSSLAARDVWSGDSLDWRKVVVDLKDLAGAELRLRWRFVSDDQEPHEASWQLRGLHLRQTTYTCDQS